ncbi:MAG: hypothetical protein MZV63_14360 [Marinilabiliales bacterium]|nr:hypothetical protein [Marinilabiliales bacterium]
MTMRTRRSIASAAAGLAGLLIDLPASGRRFAGQQEEERGGRRLRRESTRPISSR